MTEDHLRVAMVSSGIGTSTGGVGSYVFNLAQALRELGHCVTVTRAFCSPRTPFLKTILYNAQCMSLARCPRDTVLHCNTYDGSLIPRRRTYAFVTTVHGVVADEVGYFRKFRDRVLTRALARLEALSCRRADYCTAVSEYSRRRAADLYSLDPSRIAVVPACVDLVRFKPAEQVDSPIHSSCSKSILFVGRIYRRKGLEVLVRAMSVLRQPDVTLRIIGSGPDQPRIERIVRGLRLSKQVHFLGNVSSEQLVRYYQTSTVVCIPSLQEGLSIVALEAQACGVSVVATRAGGLPEAVADERLLVSPGDPHELAVALEGVLGDGSPRNHLQRMSREFVKKNFNPSRISRRMEAVYRGALSKN